MGSVDVGLEDWGGNHIRREGTRKRGREGERERMGERTGRTEGDRDRETERQTESQWNWVSSRTFVY